MYQRTREHAHGCSSAVLIRFLAGTFLINPLHTHGHATPQKIQGNPLHIPKRQTWHKQDFPRQEIIQERAKRFHGHIYTQPNKMWVLHTGYDFTSGEQKPPQLGEREKYQNQKYHSPREQDVTVLGSSAIDDRQLFDFLWCERVVFGFLLQKRRFGKRYFSSENFELKVAHQYIIKILNQHKTWI